METLYPIEPHQVDPGAVCLHMLASRCQATVRLWLAPPVQGERQSMASQLRGGVLGMAADDAFHQHKEDGRVIYRYPKVQYQWRQDHGVVLGWMESAAKVLGFPWTDLSLAINGTRVCVVDAVLCPSKREFGLAGHMLHYRLKTPVLLFNPRNHALFKALAESRKPYEMDRLLTAQLLTALRGLDIHFPARLYATFTRAQKIRCPYKKQGLIGIRGSFAANAVLPPDFAFGHAVSHGYGWIEPVS